MKIRNQIFLIIGLVSVAFGACKKADDGNEDTILLLLLAQATAVAPCTTRCHIYTTDQRMTGRLVGAGGIAGADAICNGDVNRVRGKVYKAMISVPGQREILGNPTGTLTYTDWVLKANTFYSPSTDSANTTGSTTNANRIFNDSGTAMQMNFNLSSATPRFWTGITIAGGNFINGDNCNNWTSFNFGASGFTGVVGASTTNLVEATTNTCNEQRTIICVEQ
ncbi:MAG: DUF1554 domain-containing protein [Leptospira sp.]|nr:DUF1554 domain-containing protein [Leptospira sp.]